MRALPFFFLLAACGQAGDAEIRASVSLQQGLTAADIKSLDLTIADGTSSDGTPFTCAKLGSAWIVERADAQIRYSKLLTPGNTKVTDIAKGTGFVVVLDGYATADAVGQRTAFGCVDGVTIAGGQTKSLSFTLAPLP